MLLASCGGGGGGDAGEEAQPRLSLETDAAVTQRIGPAGGTLEATSADGTRYVLTVPARALAAPVDIVMTPIAGIGDLPAAARLAAGAHLAPEGQRFQRPLTLEMTLPAPLAIGPVPFAYRGEMLDRRLHPATLIGRSARFDVLHFSGYAMLDAAFPEIQGNFVPPSERGDRALQELVTAAFTLTGTARDDAMLAALRGWLEEKIEPDVARLVGRSEFDQAAYLAFDLTATVSGDMLTFVQALKYAILESTDANLFDALDIDFTREVLKAAPHAIGLLGQGCSVLPDQALVLIAPDILAWQSVADLSGASRVDDSLELDAVLLNLCVQPDFAEVDGVGFPENMEPGQSGALTVRAGYRINGGPVRFDAPMDLGSRGVRGTAPSDELAEIVAPGETYARIYEWLPDSTVLEIEASACFESEALAFDLLCRRQTIARSSDPIEISVSPSSATVAPRGTLPFTAAVTGRRDTSVTWSATGGSISETGVFTAGDTPGVFQVTAASVADPRVRATVPVTVQVGTATLRLERRSANTTFTAVQFASEVIATDSRGTSDSGVSALPGMTVSGGGLFTTNGGPTGSWTTRAEFSETPALNAIEPTAFAAVTFSATAECTAQASEEVLASQRAGSGSAGSAQFTITSGRYRFVATGMLSVTRTLVSTDGAGFASFSITGGPHVELNGASSADTASAVDIDRELGPGTYIFEVLGGANCTLSNQRPSVVQQGSASVSVRLEPLN